MHNISSLRCCRPPSVIKSSLKAKYGRSVAIRYLVAVPTNSSLPSSLLTLRLYDSLSKSMKYIPCPSGSINDANDHDNIAGYENKTVPLPLTKGWACYTCGVTPYGPAHLGHARTYIWLDIFRRVLEDQHSQVAKSEKLPLGFFPLFVMNVTDVDDKILAMANEKQVSCSSLTERYESEFWSDLDALNCLRPHVVTRVTEYVPSAIIPYIQRIWDHGMAYFIPNDGVYFDVQAFDDKTHQMTKYGKLSPSVKARAAGAVQFSTSPSSSNATMSDAPSGSQENTEIKMDSETNSHLKLSQDIRKRDTRDFVLWKCRKVQEQMYWNSPWGEGRPGWHIECSAMIEAVAQQFQQTHQFYFHAGGIDLCFPHHTNEIAQAEAYHFQSLKRTNLALDDVSLRSKEWIPHWIHTGHLHIDGQKMSKSLKNFITIQELLSMDDQQPKDLACDSESSNIESMGRLQSIPMSPADDFRLWCLGLSGSYRAATSFSWERIKHARMKREKVIRFLLEAEEWIHGVGDFGTKVWNTRDQELFLMTRRLLLEGRLALENDLDGAKYLDGLMQLSEAGSLYLRWKTSSTILGPTEPLRIAVGAVRQMLALVGFSEVSCRAGMYSYHSNRPRTSPMTASSSSVLNGERALVEQLVSFRSAVRERIITMMKKSDESDEQLKAILSLCDELRDRTLPGMGVEIMDVKADEDADLSWRFRFPRSVTVDEKRNKPEMLPSNQKSSSIRNDWRQISLDDFFRTGLYDQLFSEFDDDGVPVKNWDGTMVSVRQRRKLIQKREKHAKRLASIVSPLVEKA